MTTEKITRKVSKGIYWHHGKLSIRYACPCGRIHRESTKGRSEKAAAEHLAYRKHETKYRHYCLDEERQASKRLRLQQQQARQQQTQQRTVQSVIAEYLTWAETAYPRSYTFRRAACQHLEQALGAQLLKDVTLEDIRRYVRQRLAAGAKPGTVNRERAVLSHLFNRVIELGLVETNPVSRLKPLQEERQQPRCLTEQEEFQLLAALPERYRPIVRFALCTGLRLGELQAQLWKDVLWEERKLIVSQPKSGRADESIPLTQQALEVLHSLDRKPGRIFMVPTKLGRIFTQYAGQAGLEGVTFKVLRSTFCSRLAQYVPPAALKALARHAKIETTLTHYVSFTDDYLRTLLEQLPGGAGDRDRGEITDTLLHQLSVNEGRV